MELSTTATELSLGRVEALSLSVATNLFLGGDRAQTAALVELKGKVYVLVFV